MRASRSSATRWPPPVRRAVGGGVPSAPADERLYLQLHAYMLRVAIPYGTLSSRQMRMLAHIARSTTRATAISPRARTSSTTGSSSERRPTFCRSRRCRDARHPDQRQLHPQHHRRPLRRCRRRRDRRPAPDGPRCCASGRRSTRNSRFLPRKFKIAVIGSATDRAAIRCHDIGLSSSANADGGWATRSGSAAAWAARR
jgi:sulfite reductase (NADPH) hemoprotein beta-component